MNIFFYIIVWIVESCFYGHWLRLIYLAIILLSIFFSLLLEDLYYSSDPLGPFFEDGFYSFFVSYPGLSWLDLGVFYVGEVSFVLDQHTVGTILYVLFVYAVVWSCGRFTWDVYTRGLAVTSGGFRSRNLLTRLKSGELHAFLVSLQLLCLCLACTIQFLGLTAFCLPEVARMFFIIAAGSTLCPSPIISLCAQVSSIHWLVYLLVGVFFVVFLWQAIEKLNATLAYSEKHNRKPGFIIWMHYFSQGEVSFSGKVICIFYPLLNYAHLFYLGLIAYKYHLRPRLFGADIEITVWLIFCVCAAIFATIVVTSFILVNFKAIVDQLRQPTVQRVEYFSLDELLTHEFKLIDRWCESNKLVELYKLSQFMLWAAVLSLVSMILVAAVVSDVAGGLDTVHAYFVGQVKATWAIYLRRGVLTARLLCHLLGYSALAVVTTPIVIWTFVSLGLLNAWLSYVVTKKSFFFAHKGPRK